MASNLELIEYISEQIAECGIVRYRKMFGEYMIYLNEKPIFLICDDNLYVKINEATTALLGKECDKGYPYTGASLHFRIDFIDDKTQMTELANTLERVIPLPKPKKRKQK